MDLLATVAVVAGFTAYMAYEVGRKEISFGSASTIWGIVILAGVVLSGGVLLKKPESAFIDGIGALVAAYGLPGFIGAVIGAIGGHEIGDREAKRTRP